MFDYIQGFISQTYTFQVKLKMKLKKTQLVVNQSFGTICIEIYLLV